MFCRFTCNTAVVEQLLTVTWHAAERSACFQIFQWTADRDSVELVAVLIWTNAVAIFLCYEGTQVRRNNVFVPYHTMMIMMTFLFSLRVFQSIRFVWWGVRPRTRRRIALFIRNNKRSLYADEKKSHQSPHLAWYPPEPTVEQGTSSHWVSKRVVLLDTLHDTAMFQSFGVEFQWCPHMSLPNVRTTSKLVDKPRGFPSMSIMFSGATNG